MGQVALYALTFACGIVAHHWWEKRRARIAREAHLEMVAKFVYGVDRMTGETVDQLLGRCWRKVDASMPADKRAN